MPRAFAGARRACPTSRSARSRGFFEGDRLRARARRDRARRRSTFPRRRPRSRRVSGPAVRARAVSRPDRGVQGFRRALSGRDARSGCRSPAEPPMTILVATSGDTGGAVAAAFHRRPWVRVVILYPKGLVSSAAGAAAHLLGRQCDRAAHRRHLRRLPAAGEGGLRRFALERAGIISAPRTASTSAVCCRRWSTTRRRASMSSGAPARRPRTSSRQAISATPSPPCGRARSGFPIERIVLAHNANRTVPDFLRDRRMAAAPEHPDARLGHGRRQPEQHGAAARALSDIRRDHANT